MPVMNDRAVYAAVPALIWSSFIYVVQSVGIVMLYVWLIRATLYDRLFVSYTKQLCIGFDTTPRSLANLSHRICPRINFHISPSYVP